MIKVYISICLSLLIHSSVFANTEEYNPELRQLLIKAIETTDSFDDRFAAEVWLVDMSSRLEVFIKDEDEKVSEEEVGDE